MVVAELRQFPWIADEFAAVMNDRTLRAISRPFERHGRPELPQLNALAAHQFMGVLNEFVLWPWMLGRESYRAGRGRHRGSGPDVPPVLPTLPIGRGQSSRRRSMTLDAIGTSSELATASTALRRIAFPPFGRRGNPPDAKSILQICPLHVGTSRVLHAKSGHPLPSAPPQRRRIFAFTASLLLASSRTRTHRRFANCAASRRQGRDFA